MDKPIDTTQPRLRIWKPFERMSWLVRFSCYAKRTASERKVLREEAHTFTRGAYSGGAPTDAQARALAVEVGSALRHGVLGPDGQRERWRVPLAVVNGESPIAITVVPGQPLGYFSRSFETAFYLKAADLISIAGRHVRVCKRWPRECFNLFAVLRTGAYCSKRCQQSTNMARYRDAKRAHKRFDEKQNRTLWEAKKYVAAKRDQRSADANERIEQAAWEAQTERERRERKRTEEISGLVAVAVPNSGATDAERVSALRKIRKLQGSKPQGRRFCANY